MAADSRSTHTDALATLGTIINESEKRDAIHLGVEPIVAATQLNPGQHVGIQADGKARGAHSTIKLVGIVDPFLQAPVKKGERFWLIVYPRQITSLRHVWEHPDFPDSKETSYIAHKSQGKTWEEVLPKPTEEQLHKANLLLGEEKAVAKEAIRQIADSLGVDYDELISRAGDFQRHGDYWVDEEDGGKFEGESVPTVFWDHYSKVTGEEVPSNNRYSFLSCSC